MKTFLRWFAITIVVLGYLYALIMFGRGVALGAAEPELANRVQTLERAVEACCGTELGLSAQDEVGYEAYVALKKRVTALEQRLQDLEVPR